MSLDRGDDGVPGFGSRGLRGHVPSGRMQRQPVRGPGHGRDGALVSGGDKRQAAKQTLKGQDVARNELSHRQPDHVGGACHIRDDALDLCPAQTIGNHPQTKDRLIAVHTVNVQMDGDLARSGSGQPLQKRFARRPQVSGLNACRPHASIFA